MINDESDLENAIDNNSRSILSNLRFALTGTLTAVILAMLIPTARPQALAQEHQPRIAFVSNRTERNELYTMDINGENILQITDRPTRTSLPLEYAWSPDGNELAVASDKYGDFDIWVCTRDAQNWRNLSKYHHGAEDINDDKSPAWSPDGRMIAYLRWVDISRSGAAINKYGLKVMSTSTGGFRFADIRIPQNDEAQHSYSPDGIKILYTQHIGADNWDIFLRNADDGIERLTTTSSMSWNPTWSPNGTKIAFESNRTGNYEVYIMNPDGSAVVNLTGTSGGMHPIWSPDGNKIVFMSYRDGRQVLCVMNNDGSNQLAVGNLGGGIQLGNNIYSWSPDSSQLVFSSNAEGNFEIYTVQVDGSSLRRLTNNRSKDTNPSWSP